MPGRCTAEMLAELQDQQNRELHIVAEFVGPTGTLYWGLGDENGHGGVCDSDGQRYEGVLARVGVFGESADLTGLGVQGSSDRQIEIIETSDNPWWSILISSGYRMASSTATFYLTSPHVTRAKWLPLWSGKLKDWPTGPTIATPNAKHWTLNFVSVFSILSTEIKYELNESNSPGIDSLISGTCIPIVFGHFDSWSGEQKGSVTCVRDNASANTYAVNLWRSKSTPTVWSGGTPKLPVTDYATSYPSQSGIDRTRLTFTADQLGAAITVDIDGMESAGNVSGTLVDDEVDMLELLLLNFVFNKRQGAAWYTRLTAPVVGIDTTSFDVAKTFLANRANGTARRGAWLITTGRTALDMLTEWSSATGLAAYWTTDGKVALAVDSPHKDAYVSGPVILASECVDDGEVGIRKIGWGTVDESNRSCDRVAITSGQSACGPVSTLRFGNSWGPSDREQTITSSFPAVPR